MTGVDLKQQVHDFWNKAACGEAVTLKGQTRDAYREHSRWRYQVEPFIEEFAEFEKYAGLRVLEIGVGLGADHQRFAEAGAILYGADLTQRAIWHTQQRFNVEGLTSHLQICDAENLPIESNIFDLVYTWGVLHHTPNTQRAIDEVHRVLKPGGEAKIMIYHRMSIVGWLLWLRYALARCRPATSLDEIYAVYLESPGTKAYSKKEAKQMCSRFAKVSIRIILGNGDLLEEHVGQGHRGLLLSVAKIIWPRPLIRSLCRRFGLIMEIRGVK